MCAGTVESCPSFRYRFGGAFGVSLRRSRPRSVLCALRGSHRVLPCQRSKPFRHRQPEVRYRCSIEQRYRVAYSGPRVSKSADPQSQFSCPISCSLPFGNSQTGYTDPHSVHSAAVRVALPLLTIPQLSLTACIQNSICFMTYRSGCSIVTDTEYDGSASR